MLKTILLSFIAFTVLSCPNAQCGKEEDLLISSEEVNLVTSPKANPWVSPLRPPKDDIQMEKDFRGDVPCWAEQDLIENTKRYGRNQNAIMTKDPGELHLKEWYRGPKVGTFENYAFNWAVWRGQVAVLRQVNIRDFARENGAVWQIEDRLGKEIDIFRKYEHLWGQAGRDVMSVFEAYYQWLRFSRPVERSKPFADRNLPFYHSSLTRKEGEYLAERDMAFFMQYVDGDLPIERDSHNQSLLFKSWYYDQPPSDAKMGVTERFIRNQYYMADRRRETGLVLNPYPNPSAMQYTLDDYATFAKYGIYFDAAMWKCFADFFINSDAAFDAILVERLILSVFSVVPDISDPGITFRMAQCYMKLADHLTDPSQQIPRLSCLKHATHWSSKVLEAIESKKVLLCDAEDGDLSAADNELLWCAGIYSSRNQDVGHEGSERYVIFPPGQDLFLRIEDIILQSQDEVLDRFLPCIQGFIERYHIRQAVNQRELSDAFEQDRIRKEVEAQAREARGLRELTESGAASFSASSSTSDSTPLSVSTPPSVSTSTTTSASTSDAASASAFTTDFATISASANVLTSAPISDATSASASAFTTDVATISASTNVLTSAPISDAASNSESAPVSDAAIASTSSLVLNEGDVEPVRAGSSPGLPAAAPIMMLVEPAPVAMAASVRSQSAKTKRSSMQPKTREGECVIQ